MRLNTADRLAPQAVKALLKHTSGCNECQILVYEDGPYAKRKKPSKELKKEGAVKEDERKKLKIKFFVSLGYSFPSFAVAQWAIGSYFQGGGPDLIKSEQSIQAVKQLPLDPRLFLFLIMVVIAAWGLTNCWTIATRLWIDTIRLKEAVPFFGKKWADKTRKNRKEMGD